MPAHSTLFLGEKMKRKKWAAHALARPDQTNASNKKLHSLSFFIIWMNCLLICNNFHMMLAAAAMAVVLLLLLLMFDAFFMHLFLLCHLNTVHICLPSRCTICFKCMFIVHLVNMYQLRLVEYILYFTNNIESLSEVVLECGTESVVLDSYLFTFASVIVHWPHSFGRNSFFFSSEIRNQLPFYLLFLLKQRKEMKKTTTTIQIQ